VKSSRTEFESWIEKLSEPSAKFGGMPECPFAKRAWQEAGVVFENCEWRAVKRLTQIVCSFDPDDSRVHVLSFTPEAYDHDLIENIVDGTNTCWPHLLVLATHPNDDAPSHPSLGLIFIQRRADMIAAVDALRETPYYDNNPLPEWYTE
jgi:hypothetical protein